jgi:hypothetical protein
VSSPEADIARELAPAVLQSVWPVIYSAGFAGVVCLVLLWILYKTLSRHTEAQIKNTMQLEEISKDLKEIARSFKDMERFIERRRG